MQPLEIVVKDPEVLQALMTGIYHYKLRPILSELICLMISHNITPTITSAYREGDPGVHGCGRGIDLRTRNTPLDILKSMYKKINNRWTYDPKRPHLQCLIYHDSGLGSHLHLQVHPNTIKMIESPLL